MYQASGPTNVTARGYRAHLGLSRPPDERAARVVHQCTNWLITEGAQGLNLLPHLNPHSQQYPQDPRVC